MKAPLMSISVASAHFDEISRKLTAGPLTLEYFVAYSIEAYSRQNAEPHNAQKSDNKRFKSERHNKDPKNHPATRHEM